jgi:hypothetical protein
MTRSNQSILGIALLLTAGVSSNALGQDSTSTLMSIDEVMTDVLNFHDPLHTIWPDVNMLEVEALSEVIERLTQAYDADRQDADERTRLIEKLIGDSEYDEQLIKESIKVAKDADDDVEKKRLEELKKVYATRRKYLSRIGDLRENERELSETRIDYVSQLAVVLENSKLLLAARESGEDADLLAAERELIRQSRELGNRLAAVASNVKKVNSTRDKAFDQREKLISAHK